MYILKRPADRVLNSASIEFNGIISLYHEA